ncbi:MAG: beta-glucanase (GH16 family) [Cellvibrionaceae bacterium]|jgi:beta-glucanase (GH16 family)
MFEKIIKFPLLIIFVCFFIINSSQAEILVWHDEFDYQGLPDSSKWDYEVGYVRNKELQYYKEASLDNSFVSDGVLTLRAIRHDDTRSMWDQLLGEEFIPVTSASLTTKGLSSWKYGRMEIRAKLPLGRGVWPAFWTLGENISSIRWPKCGEIDVMEFVGSTPRQIHGGVHFYDYKLGKKSKLIPLKGEKLFTDSPDKFHTYGIEWDEKEIRFFFDGRQWKKFNISTAGDTKNPFNKPHFIIINLAMGGAWAGTPSDDIYPVDYIIDYVRVYQ